MSGMFGGAPKMPKVKAQPVPKATDENVSLARKRERLAALYRQGRQSTNVTGGVKTLLGT